MGNTGLYEARVGSINLFPFLAYLWLLRKVKNSDLSSQSLPWLRLKGKPNYLALLDRGPYTYWTKLKEATDLLESSGFQIISLGTTYQIDKGWMCSTREELKNLPLKGMLYVVCKKDTGERV